MVQTSLGSRQKSETIFIHPFLSKKETNIPENLLCAKHGSDHFESFKSGKTDHVGCYMPYKET